MAASPNRCCSPNGRVRLLEQARGTYRKMLQPKGGFENVPVKGSDCLLTPDEIRQLREMVADVKQISAGEIRARRPAAVGHRVRFNGQLRLFQIRPLARYQEERRWRH
jgi:hypothetical protein